MSENLDKFEKAFMNTYLQELKEATDGLFKIYQELKRAGFSQGEALALLIAMIQSGKSGDNE